MDLVNSFQCICQEGWSGDLCDEGKSKRTLYNPKISFNHNQPRNYLLIFFDLYLFLQTLMSA